MCVVESPARSPARSTAPASRAHVDLPEAGRMILSGRQAEPVSVPCVAGTGRGVHRLMNSGRIPPPHRPWPGYSLPASRPGSNRDWPRPRSRRRAS